MVFVNNMDHAGAMFFRVVGELRESLGSNAVPIQIPIGEGNSFRGVIDLVRMVARIYNPDVGTDIYGSKIPAGLTDVAREYRRKLIEAVAEMDAALLEKSSEGGELTADELDAALRRGTISGAIVPVLCGAASLDRGVMLLTDAVAEKMPAPTDVPTMQGHTPDGAIVERRVDDHEPLLALAFKTVSHADGRLTFIRVYSGVLKKGGSVLNPGKQKKERTTRLVVFGRLGLFDVDELRSGHIGAAIGLEDTFQGDTLCDDTPRLSWSPSPLRSQSSQWQLGAKPGRTMKNFPPPCELCL